MNSFKVSVVMPAFNEEGHIGEAINLTRLMLTRLGYDYEIIVVDDGSSDNTMGEALRVAENPEVKVVGYSRNMGKGFAIKYGIQYVTGDIAVFLDSDLEVNYKDLRSYIEALRYADLAVASKWHPRSKVQASFMRRFLSLGFHSLVRLLTGLKVSDTQSGLKACKTKVLRRILHLLSVKKYAFDVELLTVAQLLRVKIIELPVEIKLSASFSVRAILRMLIDLLGITYRLRVKRWYQRNINNLNAEYKPILKL